MTHEATTGVRVGQEGPPGERRRGLRSVLSWPRLYRAYHRAIGARAMREAVVTQLRPKPGDRLLDIGCGTADILEYLPDVEYVGFDQSERYIKHARARWGTRGRFFVADIQAVDVRKLGKFELGLAHGVVHHLPDDIASRVFALAAAALVPTGRFVTIDSCHDEQQSWLARLIVSADRGRAIRNNDEYRALARESFDRVDAQVHHSLLHIPFTLSLVTCEEPRT